MVRHEAAEALGAIALPECLAVLRTFTADLSREVAETCQLALRRIEYWNEQRCRAATTLLGTKGSRKETAFVHNSNVAAAQATPCDSLFASGG